MGGGMSKFEKWQMCKRGWDNSIIVIGNKEFIRIVEVESLWGSMAANGMKANQEVEKEVS